MKTILIETILQSGISVLQRGPANALVTVIGSVILQAEPSSEEHAFEALAPVGHDSC